MPILKTDPTTLKERTLTAFNEVSKAFLDHQEVFIRRWFDNAVLDETALACIRLASEMGFDELAKDMIKDYNSEVHNEGN